MSGSGFLAAGQTTTVTFPNSVVVADSDFEVFTNTQLVLRVPSNATSGAVSVTVGAEESNSLGLEIVLPFTTPPTDEIIVVNDHNEPVLTRTDLMISMQDFRGLSDAQALAGQFAAQVIGYLPASNTFTLRCNTTTIGDLLDVSDAISAAPSVAIATLRLGLLTRSQQQDQTSVELRYSSPASDGRTGLWAWDRIQAVGAWRVLEGVSIVPASVRIGMFDTGIFQNHVDFTTGSQIPDLRTVTDSFADVAYSGGDPTGHGTAMAGIIGAASNGIGIDGVIAPPLDRKGVPYKIYVWPGPRLPETLQFLNFSDDVGKAIGKASYAGIHVFNISMGVGVSDLVDPLMRGDPRLDAAQARDRAISIIRGNLFTFRVEAIAHPKMLLVVAAGNQNLDLNGTPDLFGSIHSGGIIPTVIVVGGIGPDDNRWQNDADVGSNFGSAEGLIDLAAPGEAVLKPDIPSAPSLPRLNSYRGFFELAGQQNSIYSFTDGTSPATAFVSGGAALIQSISDLLSASEIKQVLIDSALKVKIDLPGNRKVVWPTLKLADAVVATLRRKGLAENAIPSWSRVYSHVIEGSFGGISRFGKVRRSGNTYAVDTAEARSNVAAQLEWYTCASNGRSLAYVSFNQGRTASSLASVDLRTFSGSTLYQTSVPNVLCGGSSVSRNFHDFPHSMSSGAAVFTSKQDFACGDTTDDVYRRGRDGSVTRLTFLDPSASVVAKSSVGNPVTIGIPVILDNPVTSQDNRWLMLSNRASGDPGHLYLLQAEETPFLPGGPVSSTKSNATTTELLVLTVGENNEAVRDISRPAISPDGARIAYIDRQSKQVKIALLVRAKHSLVTLVQPWHATRVLTLPVTSNSFFTLAWSPDGSHILLTDTNGSPDIRIITAASGEYTSTVTSTASTLLTLPQGTGSFRVLNWGWKE